MKKILLALSLLSLSCGLSAQKVIYDKMNALNKRIMYTDWVTVNWESDTYKLEASMLLEGKDTSLMLNWQCKEMLGVERAADVVLSFTDGTDVILSSKVFAVSGVGKVETEHVSSSMMGIQIDAKGDITPFADKTLKNIKMITTSGTIDFPVNEKEAANLNLLYTAFETALNSKKAE